MRKYISIFLSLILICIFLIAAKSLNKTYRYPKADKCERFEEFYIVKTIYYPNKVVVYWKGSLDNIDDYTITADSDSDCDVDCKKHKIIFIADKPKKITSFEIRNYDLVFNVRYLDTDNYCMLRTTYDTAGGAHVEGNTDRYYTKAEKDNFKKLQEEQKAARTYQEELFDEYLGTWRAYNGNKIRFYIDDNGERRVSITDTIDNPFIKFEDSVPEGYTASIALDAYTCGMQYRFDICVDGDQMTTSVTGDRVFYKEIGRCNLRPELKPVIYLYPTEDNAKISVRMDYDGNFIELDPAFNIDNGWNVTADKNGTIHLNDDKYDYLFWEGIPNATYHIDEGFCVKGEDTKDFLEQSLKTLGLNEKEADEFTDFWVPKMKDNTYNVICFQNTQYTNHSKLLVTPQPDCMIRVFMSWYGSDEYVELEPQSLQASERTGFTVVEWGGSEIK